MKLIDILNSYVDENGDIVWANVIFLDEFQDLEDDVDPSHYEIRITI